MESSVKDHYNSENLTQNIKAALIKAGKDLSNLEIRDLSPIDQLHTGGALASIELFKKTDSLSGKKVLDAGCGIGGSSRLLAKNFNCSVTGIDLADKFIEAADFLTRCTKLEDKVTFQQGSVLKLPFEDNTFDAILCQHILMNIENKEGAIKEFARVLKPEGNLILHEVSKGENQTLLFPVPWADKPSISFLEPWDKTLESMEKHGFQTSFYSDGTKAAYQWWEKVNAFSRKQTDKKASPGKSKAKAPGTLNPGLIFGVSAKSFGENMYTNFKNNSVCLIEAVMKKR
jgi:ubiquinone/menaquinone biosynthesis C-methylase UbiE